jgi:heterodisulfide reductase subunit C
VNRITFGFRYVRHWVRRTAERVGLLRRGDELEALLEQYRDVALTLPALDERSSVLAAQACVSCSACTLRCRSVREGQAPPAFEPKLLVLELGNMRTRQTADFNAWSVCARCADCTARCPFGVPIHRLTKHVAGSERREPTSPHGS